MMKVRFNLKWLLVGIAICAVAAWWISQAGMTVAHVIIISNRLSLNEQGTVDGQLQCQLVEANDYTFAYSDFVCDIYHVDQPDLIDLKDRQRAKIRYRKYDIGPFLKRDDPYYKFLNRHLGIPNSEVLGAVRREDWMEIRIRGKQPPKEPVGKQKNARKSALQ